MNPRDQELDRVLDRALEEIRESRPDAQFVEAASERVGRRLEELEVGSAEAPGPRHIESCDDFQTLLPGLLGGGLDRARRLLLEDHLGECVTCRRAYKQMQAARASTGTAVSGAAKGRPGWVSTWGLRVAAAAAIFVALVGISFETDVFSFETGGLIHIEAVEGKLYKLSDEGTEPLQPGDTLTLQEGEEIRTAKDSVAMLSLADDSKVEMRERSELAVLAKKSWVPGRKTDGVIDLERGSVIVEASEQGSGHLYVRTNDCDVAVTGTVFSVNHGMKGSRVSVIEGEVHVRHSGTRDVLQAGEQTTTNPSLDHVPLAQEIAWSRNSEQYLELLREMKALSEEIDQVFLPGLRYTSELLDLAPRDTVVYFAMPNVSDELHEAYQILQARVSTTTVLRDWWDTQVVAPGIDVHLEEMIEKIAVYGEHFGEEIALTLQVAEGFEVAGPLFLARIENPAAFMAKLSDDLAELNDSAADEVYLIEGPLVHPVLGDPEVFFWAHEGTLAVAADFRQLMALNAVLEQVEGSSLSGSSFHDRLSETYRGGVEWAVGVDLERLVRIDDSADAEALEKLGLLDVQHLVGERKQHEGVTENRVELTFDQPRRMLAAWLAEPAALGALDYISPEANMAVAFVMKDVDVLVDELFAFADAAEEGFVEHLAQFEQEHGIDIRADFAAPLGGEFAMALDGPVLPTPSWKFVMEVYDPARLVNTLEWIVEQANREMVDSEFKGLTLEREQVGGREFFRLESLDAGMSVHFIFDGGYLVAGPSRGLIERALDTRATGITLTDSPAFIELLPQDGQVNFSGAFYHNLGSVLGPLSKTLASAGLEGFGLDQQQLVQEMAGEAKPSLALLYGERDRIVLTATSEGGLISSALSSLYGFGGLMGMQQSLLQMVEDQAHTLEHGDGRGDTQVETRRQ